MDDGIQGELEVTLWQFSAPDFSFAFCLKRGSLTGRHQSLKSPSRLRLAAGENQRSTGLKGSFGQSEAGQTSVIPQIMNDQVRRMDSIEESMQPPGSRA